MLFTSKCQVIGSVLDSIDSPHRIVFKVGPDRIFQLWLFKESYYPNYPYYPFR